MVKDYGSFLLYAIPCTVTVVFSSMVLVPRFEQLLEVSNSNKELPTILSVMVGAFRFFFDYFYLTVPPLFLALGWLEVSSSRWRSVRHLVLPAISLLFVFSTILALVVLATSALAIIPIPKSP